MRSYLIKEFLPLVGEQLLVDLHRAGLFGHSMGGHGALTLTLRHPGMFKSLSAFAPIATPTECPWGRKALTGYLGEDREAWKAHDPSLLMAAPRRPLWKYATVRFFVARPTAKGTRCCH